MYTVTGTVRYAFLFSQLVVPNCQTTKPSGNASIFCNFISSPQQKIAFVPGRLTGADDAPSPHGEAARTQRAESTDEHACWMTHLYFRKPLYFLAKHADFLQLLLEYSFPTRAQVRTRQVVFVFSLHLFTRLLQRNDCQHV